MPFPERLLDRPKRLNLTDEARFIRNWLEKPLTTGAVSPSGRALANMMARQIDPGLPGQILELGPGTGPVTGALLRRGVAPERLVLIEFNPDFVPLLRKRFPGAEVVQGDAYQVSATLAGKLHGRLAGIVSSLPLLTKPPEQRRRLLSDCFDLSVPGAPFVQFTYAVMSPIPPEVLGSLQARGSSVVWRNLPPARVWVYRRQAAG